VPVRQIPEIKETNMKTVLVVDDSEFIYTEIKDIVEKDGNYKVVGYAKNGEDGLKKYFDLKPDVTTLDIIMPGMDGIETAQKIIEKDDSAFCRLIMVSSLCDASTLNEINSIGLKYLIPKPIEKEILLYTLNRIIKEQKEAI
jgi:two-component system chemotaxis response regulator CheY